MMLNQQGNPVQLGFIGIGPMGGKMSRWLMQAGYPMMIADIDQAKLDAIEKEGARVTRSNAELVGQCDVVLTSLPLSEVWVDVAEKELVPNARPGQIFIDMGTVTPPETRRVEKLFRARGAHLIDSPVSNGGSGTAKLHIFIGGEKEIVDKVWPLYEIMGYPDRYDYVGPSGCGQVVKGVNQLGIGLVNAALLEILSMAVNCGVDPQAVRKVVCVQGADNWRGCMYRMCDTVSAGEAKNVVVKHGQLTHYLKEAEADGFSLPLTRALYDYLKDVPETIRDANRRSPSMWDELTHK